MEKISARDGGGLRVLNLNLGLGFQKLQNVVVFALGVPSHLWLFGFFVISALTYIPMRVTKHFGFQQFLCAASPQRMEIKHLPFFLSIDLGSSPISKLFGYKQEKERMKKKA